MIEDRLKDLGIVLPPPPKPLASYVPAKEHNGLIYVSGQLPMKDGKLMMTGPMNPGDPVEDAQKAMEQCLINGISAASVVATLEKLDGILRLSAFVSSATGFSEQHLVANGASDLAVQIFGEAGVHTRAAVGVSALPMDATVELEMIFIRR